MTFLAQVVVYGKAAVGVGKKGRKANGNDAMILFSHSSQQVVYESERCTNLTH